MNTIPLSNPCLTLLEKKLVMQVLQSSQLSLGSNLVEFEHRIARFIGSKYAIAVNSGTSALHLCVKALDIQEGDEVITTPFSFVASANCMLYEHAKPVFVDIDPNTFNMETEQIRDAITAKTRAILPVHVFGLPCDMQSITEIASEFNLGIIEDACEAIGAECRIRDPHRDSQNGNPFIDKKVGGIGDCSAFGFYPNKQITTGEGGVVVTNSESIAKLCRSWRNQGRSESQHWLQHERLGYNYRLSEINCALGVAQMQHIRSILLTRNKVAQWYNERLLGAEEIIRPFEPQDARRSWFVYVVRLQDRFTRRDRDNLMENLRKNGIECRSYFPPIHLQPFYAKTFGYKRGDFPNTEHLADRTIALPFFTNMTEFQVERVCAVLLQELRKIASTKNVPLNVSVD